MICKYCNAENPDEAVYCSACGKRIDGKIVCPQCGTANEETAVFCFSCGKRLDGKHTCPACGALLAEGAHFCSACGKAFVSEETREEVSEVPESPEKGKKPVSYWLNLSGGIALLASALFSFIFVFCLGLSAGTSESISVYDFFSNIYKSAKAVVDAFAFQQDTEFLAFSQYFNAAVGTLIAAGSFISIPVCLVIAGIRFARSLRGKEGNRDYFKPAAAAYAVYLCSACVLLSLYASTGDADGGSSISMNGATLAGTILGGIFLAAGYALRFSAKGKPTFRSVVKALLSAAGAVLSVIVLAFASQGMVGLNSAASGRSANVMIFFALSSMQYISDITLAPPTGQLVTAMLSELFQFATIALAVALMVLLLKNLSEETSPAAERRTLTVSGVLVVCAAICLAMSVVFGTLFLDFLGAVEGADVSMSYTAPIVAFVFSALLVGVSVAKLIFSRKKGNEEQTL